MKKAFDPLLIVSVLIFLLLFVWKGWNPYAISLGFLYFAFLLDKSLRKSVPFFFLVCFGIATVGIILLTY